VDVTQAVVSVGAHTLPREVRSLKITFHICWSTAKHFTQMLCDFVNLFVYRRLQRSSTSLDLSSVLYFPAWTNVNGTV